MALATFLVLTASCAAGVYYWFHEPPAQVISAKGFDVSHVEAPAAEAAMAYASHSAAQPAASPAPLLVKGAGPLSLAAGAPPAAQLKLAAKTPPAPAPDIEHEKEFLKRQRAAVIQYQARLARITDRYRYGKGAPPIVGEVDRAFGAMPRFMAVRGRYDRDRNPFQYARDALALPEVRGEMARRMKDPQVWRAAIGMMLEALKEPPPPELYKETKRFLATDAVMVSYLPELVQGVTQNIAAVISGIPPGADITPLNRLANDMVPQLGGVGGPAPAARR